MPNVLDISPCFTDNIVIGIMKWKRKSLHFVKYKDVLPALFCGQGSFFCGENCGMVLRKGWFYVFIIVAAVVHI